MLQSEKKAAAASTLAGRTARVCDSCLCKRARWFCAADDAFLCQTCDVSVHSANQLARRHDRIRLETASFKSTDSLEATAAPRSQLPPWLKGFTRKARTPRPNKQLAAKTSVFSLVPEIGNDEGLLDDNEEEHNQFLHHQVPVFDPFGEEKLFLTDELEDFADGFLPSEVDLAEFVADVESLLGRQQDEDETESRLLKVKDEEQDQLLEDGINNGFLGGDILDWNFKGEEIEEEKVVPMAEDEVKTFNIGHEQKMEKKKKIFLRLNYDAVITAWDGQSSPYTTGNRPELDLDDCWGEWPGWLLHQSGDKGTLSGRAEWKNDGEREARVSRYREKRRTRLFSKKIRYQVRKLNAEKRPRMKGRFVKRTAPLMSTSHVTFP